MPPVELTAYFDQIDAPPAVRARAEQLHTFYSVLTDLGEATTLLSEVVAEDGSRDFQGLWIFTPEWVMEARFSEGDSEELDGTALTRLVRWVLKATRFDFRKATPESRLTAELWFAGEVIGELHASGANCEALSSTLARYVAHLAAVPTSPSGSL